VPESYRITGRIRGEGNNPVEGFTVQAFDKELGIFLHPDDRLGRAVTGSDGVFRISFGRETFKDWLQSNPKVYLTIRDRTGKIMLQTEAKSNTTGDIDFEVRLGAREIDTLAPDIYQDGLRRIASSLRASSGAVDMSRSDILEMSEILFRAVDSWTIYRDQLFRVAGYDGIQVPAEPRKERHDHVTRWDKPVLPS